MTHLHAVPLKLRPESDVFENLREATRASIARQRRGLFRLASDHGVTVPVNDSVTDSDVEFLD